MFFEDERLSESGDESNPLRSSDPTKPFGGFKVVWDCDASLVESHKRGVEFRESIKPRNSVRDLFQNTIPMTLGFLASACGVFLLLLRAGIGDSIPPSAICV